MEWVTDSELITLLGSNAPPLLGVEKLDISDIQSQVQPCSVDLRIDEIFLPMKDVSDVSAVSRTSLHELAVGQSAKVNTIESFDFDNGFSAILFAPARLSRRGIVVPDIGHIDPGFKGKLRLTLINMGRDPYSLRKGDTVGTVLIFRLRKNCAYGLGDRVGQQPYSGGLDDIKHLSPDFLNLKQIVKALARTEARRALGKSGWKYSFLVLFLPILVLILIAVVGYYIGVFQEDEKFRVNTEARLNSLEKATDVRKEAAAVARETASLQRQIDDLKSSSDRAPRKK